ncbi:hypothetical protein NL676_005274 [Syzygium grande]|nr:hypothetical protein NL676_005274 [Syzygium grande]
MASRYSRSAIQTELAGLNPDPVPDNQPVAHRQAKHHRTTAKQQRSPSLLAELRSSPCSPPSLSSFTGDETERRILTPSDGTSWWGPGLLRDDQVNEDPGVVPLSDLCRHFSLGRDQSGQTTLRPGVHYWWADSATCTRAMSTAGPPSGDQAAEPGVAAGPPRVHMTEIEMLAARHLHLVS